MSNSPDRPNGNQDPYAPKRVRDQDAPRPVTSSKETLPSRVELSDFGDNDPPISFRRTAPTPLVAPAPPPPTESRRSIITVREVVLLSLVSIVSALVVIVGYKLLNDGIPTGAALKPVAGPTRPASAVNVTQLPSPAAVDETSSPAPATTAVAGAATVAPTAAPAATV